MEASAHSSSVDDGRLLNPPTASAEGFFFSHFQRPKLLEEKQNFSSHSLRPAREERTNVFIVHERMEQGNHFSNILVVDFRRLFFFFFILRESFFFNHKLRELLLFI